MSNNMEEWKSPFGNKIQLRHSCGTKFIGHINTQLTVEQKAFIEGTCFGWFMQLKESTKLSRNLLSKLCSRWNEKSGCFEIRSQCVRFRLVDVCLGLGLRVVGPKFNLNESEIESKCRKMFKSKNVDLKTLHDFLLRKKTKMSVTDFCRVYILLGISEFLFPNRSGRVFPILFKVVDDLEGLPNLNWGAVVYEYLVGSICRASFLFKTSATTTHFHVDGCVYLLQLWAYEHLLMWSQKGRNVCTKFPRILHWMDVKVGDFVISRSFNKNMVVYDVVASAEEFRNVIVREAFEGVGVGFVGKGDVGDNADFDAAVQRQEEVIDELETQLHELKTLINDWKDECKEGCGGPSYDFRDYADDNIRDDLPDDKGCGSSHPAFPSVGMDDDNVDEGQKPAEVDIEDGNGSPESNMYARIKHQPRLRLKSAAIRTPFATYQRRKFHK